MYATATCSADRSSMSLRFNPPPNWPLVSVPEDWLPPAGWVPPPHLPAAPPGWAWVIEAPELLEEEQPKKQSNELLTSLKRVVLASVAGLFIIFLVTRITPFFDVSSDERDESRARTNAWVTCTMVMNKYLKSPASAGYPTTSELNVQIQGNTYLFPRAWVDSQNSFGAQIRTYFSCVAAGSGDSWGATIKILE